MTLIFFLRIAHPLKNQALLFRFVVLILDLSLPHFYLYKNPIFCSAVSLNRLETCLVFILKEEQRCKKKIRHLKTAKRSILTSFCMQAAPKNWSKYTTDFLYNYSLTILEIDLFTEPLSFQKWNFKISH